VVERLLTDLAPLADRLWLVIDDAHDLGPGDVLAQLELLVLRAPPALRFVLATRHDLRLGLHQLRLAGELTELRADDLRFSVAEARALFGAAGVQLSQDALAQLHRRTEGWAAGLRLAALSLAGHPDPDRFAAEFSGSERTVADYLLAEVLDRQSAQVRRLLLRTSLLGRVSGDLADLLTGASGGERILQDLERAGAFVVSLDAARRGSVTTACSPTCCSWSCAAPSQMRSPHCTAQPLGGWPGTDIRWKRSSTPKPRGSGGWPPACSRTTGLTNTSAGGTLPWASSWPGSPAR
jgi:ATP/maltotriose-dependent transcriptional regulator MalT